MRLITAILSMFLIAAGTVQAQPHVSAHARGIDYSKYAVNELIDELTKVNTEAPGVNSAGSYEGFLAEGTPGSFHAGLLGSLPPKVLPQMRELVRRGPLALPELVRHVDDERPTKLEVGNDESGSSSRRIGVDYFLFTYFSDEYDSRLPASPKPQPKSMQKNFHGRYTVKVGDVCYVLIGQIVNRRLIAVRYQPTAGLVVNSPIEAPLLAEMIRSDWSEADGEVLKGSLLDDIHAVNRPPRGDRTETINSALKRLRLYFPDAYNGLRGDDLKKRREFEKQEMKAPRQSRPNHLFVS